MDITLSLFSSLPPLNTSPCPMNITGVIHGEIQKIQLGLCIGRFYIHKFI